MQDKDETRPPQDQTYWWFLALSLNGISGMDQRWWGFSEAPKILKVTSVVARLFGPVCTISQLLYIIIHRSDLPFYQLETILTILPTTMLVNAKNFATETEAFKSIMENFTHKIHLYNYQNDDYAKKKLIAVERYVRYVSYALFAFINVDGVLWSLVPVLQNIHHQDAINNGTMKLQTSIYMYMPFDYAYNHKNWLILHIINIYDVFIGCYTLMLFDCVAYVVIFHLIGHLGILNNKIQSFNETFDSMDNSEVRKNISELAKYHSFIMSTFKQAQEGFGIFITGNYLYNFVLDSLMLFQVLKGDPANRMTYVIMFIFFMGNLILMSFVLEEIRRQSDGLGNAVYSLSWQRMSIPNQKLILIVLNRTQVTLQFKAAGGLRTGVQPMLSIIKSTFSYYVMLKSSM